MFMLPNLIQWPAFIVRFLGTISVLYGVTCFVAISRSAETNRLVKKNRTGALW